MLQRALLLALACTVVSPVLAPSEARAEKASNSKPKPTKATIQARLTKLVKARDAMRALAKEAAPSNLSAAQKKTYAEEMTKLVADADAADVVVGKLDTGLKEASPKLDSLSEMGEMESLRLQMAMDRLSKMMSTLSNMLKKQSDTASSIAQNLK